MRLNIALDIDNAAFEDTDEIARCLMVVAERVQNEKEYGDNLLGLRGQVLDSNGNTTGTYTVTL